MAFDQKKIIDMIKEASIVELNDLVKAIEEEFDIQAVAAVAGPAAGGEVAAAKDAFNVTLVAAGANKISVIKVVREITGLGLKEAKDLVDGAPGVIKENVKTADAEEMKAKLVEVGAEVELA